MFLIVGLGNPGKEYEDTKHNYGFLLADQLIKNYNLTLKAKKTNFELFDGEIEGFKVLVLKPLKYMNLSGSPVLEIKNFYKIDLGNVIVLHDDLDVELGKIKVKIGGGHAGHNGLRDMDNKIGKDYPRVRLGIGRPENPGYDVSDYVLSKFKKDEMVEVEMVNEKVSDLFPMLLEGDLDGFSTKFYL